MERIVAALRDNHRTLLNLAYALSLTLFGLALAAAVLAALGCG